MCGRFSLDTDLDELFNRYRIKKNDLKFCSKDEIFPSEVVPVVTNNGENKLTLMKWGFSPSYSKSLLINARSETVDSKPTFKYSFLNRRCIIPATSYYEWEKVGAKKIKRRISPKGIDIFSIAGLYSSFEDEAGRKFEAFTILTTDAHENIKMIHERMPVILSIENEEIWLDNTYKDISRLKGMFKAFDGDYIVE